MKVEVKENSIVCTTENDNDNKLIQDEESIKIIESLIRILVLAKQRKKNKPTNRISRFLINIFSLLVCGVVAVIALLYVFLVDVKDLFLKPIES